MTKIKKLVLTQYCNLTLRPSAKVVRCPLNALYLPHRGSQNTSIASTNLERFCGQKSLAHPDHGLMKTRTGGRHVRNGPPLRPGDGSRKEY